MNTYLDWQLIFMFITSIITIVTTTYYYHHDNHNDHLFT